MSALPASPVYALPTIDDFFREMTSRFKLKPRTSQLRLAELVRDTLASGGVACVEAPTGTGKTLGYLAGALDQQAHSGDCLPVVVATATVALQEQIMRDDIPRLEACGLLPRGGAVIAKGRGRYFCPRTAAVLEDKRLQVAQMDMLEPEKPIMDSGVPVALDMLKAWREKKWDGDQDTWPGQVPACWSAHCGASSETCVNRSCEHYAQCPYMQSRERMAKAQLVIANQDVVLADLAQRAENPDKSVLPFRRFQLVVDEAHNFPEKAVRTLKASANLAEINWLQDMEPWGISAWDTAAVSKVLRREGVSESVFYLDALQLHADITAFSESLARTGAFRSDGVLSWGQSAPPAALMTQVHDLAARLLPLQTALSLTVKAFSAYTEDAVGPDKSYGVRMLAHAHKFNAQASTLQKSLALFYTGENLVRWATRSRDGKVTLHTQPLEGDRVLKTLLWDQEIPTVMTSATLQIAGSFKRFQAKAGVPDTATFEALPPAFDYSRGVLHQPKMTCAPGESGYEAELSIKLDALFRAGIAPGTLVLFTSRDTMRRVIHACSDEFRTHALVADSAPIPELVARHKARIDGGGRSILVGLDSMSEGLDLPGKYCGHVVITRLPFGVPSDPVEEARQIAMGKRWFEEAYLADMLTVLIQSTGRLIRREDDHGVISLLDSRLVSKRYGVQALSALPAFYRTPKIADYFEYAKTRGFDLSHGTAAPAPAPISAPPKLEVIAGGAKGISGVKGATKPALKPVLVSSGRLEPVISAPAVAAPAPTPVRAEPPAPAWPQSRLAAEQDACLDAAGVRLSGLRPLDYLAQRYAPPETLDHEVAFVAACEQPCLPPGTSPYQWAEYAMPEAIALGVYALHAPLPAADDGHTPWVLVLRTRPDALQFADILVSHLLEREDPRAQVISESDCRAELAKMFAGMGPKPTDGELRSILQVFDDDLARILSAAHQRPGQGYMEELIKYGQGISEFYRQQHRRVGP